MRWQKWETDKDEIEAKMGHMKTYLRTLHEAIETMDEEAIRAAGEEIRAFGVDIAEIANRGTRAKAERHKIMNEIIG